MAYLTTTEYYGFIASAIQPDRGKIDLYFQSLYKEYSQDNKEDFFERLNAIVIDLADQFKKHKEDYTNDMADMLDIQNALSIEGKSFTKQTLNSIQNIDWDKIHFYYENGRIWRSERQNSIPIYEFDLRNLLRGIEELDNHLKFHINNSQLLNDRVKLKWKGTKAQLYFLLNRLKFGDNLILNKYEDLAKFVIDNVEGYEDDSLITTKENLEKGKYPKKGSNFSGILEEIKEVE